MKRRAVIQYSFQFSHYSRTLFEERGKFKVNFFFNTVVECHASGLEIFYSINLGCEGK